MKKLQVEKISEYFPLDRKKDQEGKRKKKKMKILKKFFKKVLTN